MNSLNIIVKSHEIQMDKQKGVQCISSLSVHYEPCLRCVGHMTEALLIFNYYYYFLIVRDVNRQQKVCAMCVYAIGRARTSFESFRSIG